jgi:D-ribose pyranose/furanose isomerase RbsD
MKYSKSPFGICIPILILILLAGFATSCITTSQSSDTEKEEPWQAMLDEELPLLGHRNWILVVDKSFPEQSSAGMKYFYVDQGLLPTLKQVLETVEASTHVRPVIYRDRELSYITEQQVPGIEKFREQSGELLEGRAVNTLLHDEVFSMLDQSADLFRVLVIKTSGTMPYTSVFLQLDCAYWNADQESSLREAMAGSQDH